MTEPRPKPLSLVRSLSLADLFTIGNAASGMAAIFVCIAWVEAGSPSLWWAFGLLPTAFVLDALDGRVARWRRKQSPFGGDLDSLADIVSFGVAPAVLGFAMGMRGALDAAVLVYFVACGIGRLARFNVTAAALSDETGKVKYFEGTPIPTSLSLVGVLAVAYATGAVGDQLWLGVWDLGSAELHPLVALFAASGTAMVSARLRIPKI